MAHARPRRALRRSRRAPRGGDVAPGRRRVGRSLLRELSRRSRPAGRATAAAPHSRREPRAAARGGALAMCGIAGYLAPSPVADDVLVRMTRRLAHRGPDEEGFHRAGGLGLGFRRLAVIDLALSHQPMSTPDGALTVVFNGEIYNFRELREELARRGCVFRTHGDTEVLLHAYREYGTAMLEKLRGMFAFALWDAARSRLFVARDHSGVKPLHYSWDGATFVFGSELKAVREHPAVGGALDLDALGLYLECQYIPSPKTVYRDVRKLECAHALTIEGGKLSTWR